MTERVAKLRERLRAFPSLLAGLPEYLAQLPLNRQVILTGIVVGAASGGAVFVFETLIGLFSRLGGAATFHLHGALVVVGIVLVPAAGGLVTGVLTHRYCPEAKGHGVMEVAAAIKEKGGHIEGRVMWVKALASAATIGSGGSAGREGPVVQIGAAVGSWLGRLMRVPADDLRMLVAGGAAGGIAASFSIPLAGVFFTMEVILRDLANEGFSAIVIAAVTATVTARLLLGPEAFFAPLPWEWHGPTDFLFYALLGALCAPVGIAYRSLLQRFEELFTAHQRLQDWLRPALGGFLLGALALALPQIRGTGQEAMNEVLAGRGIGWALILLAAGKTLATALTLGSGGSGGSLMPSLYVGTMAGGFYAFALNEIAGTRLEAGAFGVVGMACVFTAAFRAPVTAVVMGLEVARDYGILLPVMFGCVITHLFARGRRRSAGGASPGKPDDSGLAPR